MVADVQLTPECMDLLNRILTPKEEDRITIPEIERHPWCVACQHRHRANLAVALVNQDRHALLHCCCNQGIVPLCSTYLLAELA